MEGSSGKPNSRPSFRTHLTRFELDHIDYVEEKGVSPEEAAKFLEEKGYTPETWDGIDKPKAFSHDLRVLVIIARGQHRRLPDVLYINLRHEEKLFVIDWQDQFLPPDENSP